MEIVVKQINSKNAEKLKYGMDPKDKVSKLRRLVAVDLGIEECNIKLIFKGRFLRDETDLEMHGTSRPKYQPSSATETGKSLVLNYKKRARTGVNTNLTSSVLLKHSGLQDGSVVHAMNSSAGCKSLSHTQNEEDPSMTVNETERENTDSARTRSNLNLGDMLRNIGSGGNQIEEMMESNAELRAMMEDPEQMRLMMEIASNPQLRLEYMRNMDRALSNIESLPGGFNALASMMSDSSPSPSNPDTHRTEMSGPHNPFVRLFSTPETTRINENPMPNPWQRNPNRSTNPQQAGSFLSGPGLPGPQMSQQEMTGLMNSMFSEENMREVDRMMRDPEMRSRILSGVLGEEGSRQISGEMLENLISDFNSFTRTFRDDLPLLNQIGSVPGTREIGEAEMDSKIQILKDMGFPNEEANRRALQTSGGDVNGAVEILLNAGIAF